MLVEIKNVRQLEGEPRRRWFVDDFFDLIVWMDPADRIAGFQLCYDKNREQRALTWRQDSGYLHNRVDDGESRPGKHKLSPILMKDGEIDKNVVGALFKNAGRNIESEIAGLVYEKIIDVPETETL